LKLKAPLQLLTTVAVPLELAQTNPSVLHHGPCINDELLNALKEQEQELEQLRALLRPEHWPRIYELLRRVRREIRILENSDRSGNKDIA
jgi:hypothetical protein